MKKLNTTTKYPPSAEIINSLNSTFIQSYIIPLSIDLLFLF